MLVLPSAPSDTATVSPPTPAERGIPSQASSTTSSPQELQRPTLTHQGPVTHSHQSGALRDRCPEEVLL